MKSSSYWEKRKADIMYQQMEKAEDTSRKVSKIYAKSSEYISDKSNKLFSKFKKEYRLSDREARKIVKAMRSYNSSKELKRVLMNQNINENTKRIIDEITSSGYAFRLNYFDELQSEVDNTIRDIYKAEKRVTTSLYKNILKEGFNRSMYEIQKNASFSFGFGQPDAKQVKAVLNAKWSGLNYSDRIWENTKRLAETVKEEIAVSLLTGKSQSEMARQIDYKFGVGSFNARRLIRTEACYFENEAEAMSYEEAGIEKYRFLATLDLRTSEKCRRHDNKVYKLKDKVTGKNYPPLHPFCRSTTIAVFEYGWIKDKKRIARNKNDENVEIQNMSYEDWYDKYVIADEDYLLKEKMLKNKSSDIEQYDKYRKIYGDDIPKTFEDFQKLKYNDSKKWESLKAEKMVRIKSLDYGSKFDRTFSNHEVRSWYHVHMENIPNLIDTTKTIEEQAKQAFDMRNEIKLQARNMMKDVKARVELDIKSPIKTNFSEKVEEKMREKKLTRAQAYGDILRTSKKSNRSVDIKLGLERGDKDYE